MINKQNLWFLTLFSLILVLSVYYVTMPSELLLTTTPNNDSETVSNNDVTVTQSDVIVALNVAKEEERDERIKELEKNITSQDKTTEEKNNYYEELKLLNVLRGKEEEIVLKIKNDFSLDAYTKIENDQIRIVLASKDSSATLANEIMRSVQSLFDNKMYISVKFES